jgi:hypothetical protein
MVSSSLAIGLVADRVNQPSGYQPIRRIHGGVLNG